MPPNGEVWVVSDSSISRPNAAFTDPDELVRWLRAQSNEFMTRAMVYTLLNNPPDLVRAPTRYPMRAAEILFKGVLHV